MSRLSVVLPAYNEELMVGKTCRVLHEVLAEAGISYELVVVDVYKRQILLLMSWILKVFWNQNRNTMKLIVKCLS